MSYSNFKSGSRGRGFSSRGSHRGSSAAGGWGNGGSQRGRGEYSPPRSSRGRGGWSREMPVMSASSYEHGRSSSARYFEMNEDRFSSRSREDSSFRRYRQDSPGYSMEMSSHHHSPESPRKRMRSDHGYHQASSHHRSSHESSSFDYSPRYGGSYGNEDKAYDRYREERRNYRDHHSGERYSPRDEYLHHRKDPKDGMDRHELSRSSMPPPPPPVNPRHSASPRRSSFRGRGLERGRGSRSRASILRGSRGSRSLRKGEGISSLKRKTMADQSYAIKKKILAGKSSQEQLKKLRMQKIRRIKESLENAENQESTEEPKKEDWNETAKEQDASDATKEKPEGEGADKEETEATKDKEEDGPKADSDETKKDVEGSVQVTIKQNADGRAVNEESKESARKSPGAARRFIRLHCPHCHDKCVTFKQYTAHLYSSKHLSAMSRLGLKQKQTVLRLRQQQRKLQREEEERDPDNLMKFSSFCTVCKLNYRQNPSIHSTSKMHQEMKKLLFPYCKVCGLSFKATLLYDKHICSLEHIRREAYMEERLKDMEGRHSKRDHDDDKDIDMDGFMIVDSVGDVDDAEEMVGEKAVEKEQQETLLGLEFVRSVEAQYCDLCQRYLPRLDDAERAQGVHCRSSQHLRLFRDHQRITRSQIRVKEEKEETIKKEDVETKENGKEKEVTEEVEGGETEGNAEVLGLEVGEATENGKEEEDEPKDAEAEAVEDNADDPEAEAEVDEVAEEKLWADVDKDLGELLQNVDNEEEEEEEEEEEQAAKSSDDDESVAESDGRYDRFRYSEKVEAGKELKTEETENKKEEDAPPTVEK